MTEPRILLVTYRDICEYFTHLPLCYLAIKTLDALLKPFAFPLLQSYHRVTSTCIPTLTISFFAMDQAATNLNQANGTYEWIRSSQTLLFDQRDDAAIPGSSFLLPLRFPPSVEGIPGFVFNGRGDFGIPGMTPPLRLVGAVAEVTTGDLIVAEKGVALDHQFAKLVYAVTEDESRFTHAVSLTTLRAGSILRGLPASTFNFAGFPRWVGHPVDPDRPQSLVLGIPRYVENMVPPGTTPVLRLGWTWNEDHTISPPELMVATDCVVLPGTWLTYKLMDLGTRPDLKMAREASFEIDTLYKEAGAGGAEFGDPRASRNDFNLFSVRARNRYSSPDPYRFLSDEESEVEMETGEDGNAGEGLSEDHTTDSIPNFGNFGTTPPCSFFLGFGEETSAEEEFLTSFFGGTEEDYGEKVGSSSTPGAVVIDDDSTRVSENLVGVQTQLGSFDVSSEFTMSFGALCGVAQAILQEQILTYPNLLLHYEQVSFDAIRSICEIHLRAYRTSADAETETTIVQNFIPAVSGLIVDTAEVDNCPALVQASLWWSPECTISGQYHPTVAAWTRLGGFTSPPILDGNLKPTMILASQRVVQLRQVNEGMALVFLLRCFYPSWGQPYPMYWPYLAEPPSAPTMLTTMWDLRFDLQIMGGLRSLPATSLIAVFRFPSAGWDAGFDMNWLPTLPDPFDIVLLPVVAFDQENNALELSGVSYSDGPSTKRMRFDSEHVSRARCDFMGYIKWCLNKHTERSLDHGELVDMTEVGLEHCMLGRVPVELGGRYHDWLHYPRQDLGVGAALLRKLNPQEYTKRCGLAEEVWDSEQQEMVRFGVVPSKPMLESDPQYPLPAPSRQDPQGFAMPPTLRPQSISTTPPMSPDLLTPASEQVKISNPRYARKHAQQLASELFGEPLGTSSAPPPTGYLYETDSDYSNPITTPARGSQYTGRIFRQRRVDTRIFDPFQAWVYYSYSFELRSASCVQT